MRILDALKLLKEIYIEHGNLDIMDTTVGTRHSLDHPENRERTIKSFKVVHSHRSYVLPSASTRNHRGEPKEEVYKPEEESNA